VPQWIIEKKRDGLPLTEEEIRGFIQGYTSGAIPDYQMAALAMAVYFRGMSFDETAILTDAMMRTGRLVDTSSIPGPKADKHSTGGIGDKVSLVLAPLVACCGVAVPMISGRGLGITGGTLDKLEAIPGYRTNLSLEEFVGVLRQCGCSLIGQTAELVPADRKLYALRDVTGTVPSVPLIAASIMSKKLAEGIDALVLDVKWGKGAFMKTLESARDLARTMVEIGRRVGKRTVAVITDMNQPLGRMVGNALEIVETVQALRGKGPRDLMEVTLELGAHMLTLTGRARSHMEAFAALQRELASGAAWERLKTMVRLHGGRAEVLDTPEQLLTARLQVAVPAPRTGYVADVDAELIGKACVVLGAGRQKVEDTVDPAVGVANLAKIGARIEEGQPLLVLHANDEAKLNTARGLVQSAFRFAANPVVPPKLVVEVVR